MSIEVPVARGARVVFNGRYAGSTNVVATAGTEYQYWHQNVVLSAGHTYYAFACAGIVVRYDGTAHIEHRLLLGTTILASVRAGTERNGWASGKGGLSMRLEATWHQATDATADLRWVVIPSVDWNDWVANNAVHTFGMIDLGRT